MLLAASGEASKPGYCIQVVHRIGKHSMYKACRQVTFNFNINNNKNNNIEVIYLSDLTLNYKLLHVVHWFMTAA